MHSGAHFSFSILRAVSSLLNQLLLSFCVDFIGAAADAVYICLPRKFKLIRFLQNLLSIQPINWVAIVYIKTITRLLNSYKRDGYEAAHA